MRNERRFMTGPIVNGIACSRRSLFARREILRIRFRVKRNWNASACILALDGPGAKDTAGWGGFSYTDTDIETRETKGES